MTIKSIENSPQAYARTAGALYLAVILLGGFAEGYVANTLIVAGDAAASTRHIAGSPLLWRLGVAADLLVAVLAVPQLWIEYLLLRPVDKSLMLLAVIFNIVSLSVESVSKLFLLLIAPILGNTDYRAAFEPMQRDVLASLAFKSHDIAFNIALIFFGFTCVLYGLLIYRSGYFPKAIGILMQLAGWSYLIACSAALFAPTFGELIGPGILVFALIGESSFCLWLLIKGVDVAKWRERV